MGRSVIADENIEDHLYTLIDKDKVQIGLLIGQLTQQKDYVIHVARTPLDNGKEHSLEELDDKWLAHHATQVTRMLPGGLSVLGIFVIAPPDKMKTGQAQLRQALFTIEKRLNKLYPVVENDGAEITDRILMQLCSVAKKITCRSFDVADPKCSMRPADWRYGNVTDGWMQLKTRLAVNLSIPVYLSESTYSLEKQIMAGLSPLCETIQNSLCLMNGELTDPSTSIDTLMPNSSGTQQQKGKGKGKSSSGTSGKPSQCSQCSVKLLYNHAPPAEERSPQRKDCFASLTMRGSICARAFVHCRTATVENAQKIVKQDVCRSLLFRCQLLCEDLLQSEEEQDISVVYECPIRVFTTMPGSTVQLCDYMFQDEGPEESSGRFLELLGFKVNASNIDVQQERVPDDDDLAVPEKVLPMKQTNELAQIVKAAPDNTFRAIGATMVAFLAAGLSYLYMQE